ncbi:hypothetical protein SAMN06265373_101125 [Shimia sagamensis]|uniref:SnoaL-like domain-containing protein n=2 Tax=Shimia sagamensis TaxID=1566352 RepID=A0ABY1N6Y0_9RHOB|nr:hypothetical protein SAMN06265373_101125 [Shimia sagamensis]
MRAVPLRCGPQTLKGDTKMVDALHTFFVAWGETDATKRLEALKGALADNFTYIDPRSEAPISNLDALNGYVGMYSQYAPGATAAVVNSSETKGHHRLTVAFRMADGNEQLGQYCVELDADGRTKRMIGFAGLGEPE